LLNPTNEQGSAQSGWRIFWSSEAGFVLTVALVAVFFTRIQYAFEFTYATDDYRQIIDGLSSIAEPIIAQGRIGEYWLHLVFEFLGFDPLRAPLITIAASSLISVWVAYSILQMWEVRMPPLLAAIVIVVVSIHPYTTELLTFRGIAIYHYIALALAFLSLRLTKPTTFSILGNAALFAVALTIYQIPLGYASIFFVFDFAIRILRLVGAQTYDAASLKASLAGDFAARLAVFLIGIVLYFILFKISTIGVPQDPRSVLISFGDILPRLVMGLNLILEHFVTGKVYQNSLVPKPLLIVPFVFLAFAVFEVARATHYRPSVVAGSSLFLLVVVLGAGFAVLGVAFLSKTPWLPPRVHPHIGIFWGGAAALAYSVRSAISPKAFYVLLGLVGLIFVAVCQQIFIDHYRIRVRDHNKALLVLSRLQEDPQFANATRITVHGASPVYPAKMPTLATGLNASTWAAPWSIAPMFTELSGRVFKEANRDDRTVAAAFCKERPKWPSAGSTTVRENLAIICM
jgi:hypothetical protein